MIRTCFPKRIFTEEHRRKLSESCKGRIPWNKGKTGVYSEETRSRMAESWFKKGCTSPTEGKLRSEKTRKKISHTRLKKGIIHSKETKLKMSMAQKGKKHSYKSKLKRSLRFRGENSHFWNGGTSKEPYCRDWVKVLKDYIKERDEFTCQGCGSQECLCVHHINYDKKDCDPDNLITLCNSCNSKANFNRNFWQEVYSKAINE